LRRSDFLRGAASAGLVLAGLPSLGFARSLGDPRLSRLDARLQGRLLKRGTASYESARLIFNSRYDGVRPLAVAEVASAADVRACLQWAAAEGVPLRLRSGGHSYAGASTGSGALVVDVGRLRGIRLEADGTAVVGAGARLIDVYAALAARGRTVPAGSCPSVGIAGLALGGGHGLAVRRYGLLCDSLTGAEVLLPSGRALSVSRRREPDLLWALRGVGGGNLAVVTAFRLRTSPAPRVSRYRVAWPWSSAADALEAWQEWLRGLTPAVGSSICSLSQGSIAVFGQAFLGEDEVRARLAPLLASAPGGRLTTRSDTYLQMQRYWAGCRGRSIADCRVPEHRDRFAAGSVYLRRPLSRAGVLALVALADRGVGAILLDAYGGATERLGAEDAAFAHRHALASIQILAYWTEGAGAAQRAWVRQTRAQLRRFGGQGAYVNYIEAPYPGWQQDAYGRSLGRLRALVRRYDPQGLLRGPLALAR
jgi:FAD/FMN-containing dehydrogenase